MYNIVPIYVYDPCKCSPNILIMYSILEWNMINDNFNNVHIKSFFKYVSNYNYTCSGSELRKMLLLQLARRNPYILT